MGVKRTFGWVQNPNVLSTLKNVVSVFSSDTKFNQQMRNYKLPLLLKNGLISQTDYDEFINILASNDEGIPYEKLNIDNKSYKNGFNVDAHCADEMTRYIIQNNQRVDGEPPNEWWRNFDSNVVDFKFLFITSFLKGKFADNLKSIHTNTGIAGAAVAVDNLLYFAEDIKTGKMSKQDFFNKMNDCEMIAV